MKRGPTGRRWLRRAGIVAGAAAVGVGAGFAPRALRDVEAFGVDRVEVFGTRYLDPYAVVRAAGLSRDASVFDDADAWRSGALTLPLVDDVRVRRKLPRTVILEVREVEPVALVAAESLRPVDRFGRLLDLEPSGAAMNLPILAGAMLQGPVLADESRSAVRVLTALRERAPELAEEVSHVEVREGWLRVLFRDERVEALLPIRPAPGQLLQLRLAYEDLAARGELAEARRIDVRFRDQVVVSFLGTPVS